MPDAAIMNSTLAFFVLTSGHEETERLRYFQRSVQIFARVESSRKSGGIRCFIGAVWYPAFLKG